MTLLSTIVFATLLLPIPEKLPLPEEATVKKARKFVQERFGVPSSEVDQQKLQTLSWEILKFARENKDLSLVCGALEEAAERAVRAGDAETALEAIQEIGDKFLIDDLLTRKRKALEAITQNVKRPEHTKLKRLIRDFCLLAREAFAVEDPKTASAAASQAAKLAGMLNNSYWKDLATAVKEEAAEYSRESERLSAERKKLLTDPGNQGAKLKQARFSCFIKGDWEKGLGILAKGGDENLSLLAELDLRKPTNTQERLELAERWQSLGKDREKSRIARRSLGERAAYLSSASPCGGRGRLHLSRWTKRSPSWQRGHCGSRPAHPNLASEQWV